MCQRVKKTEVNKATESIRDFIIKGKAQGMQKFPSEATLGEQLGVSRLTVREALTVLENEGYIARRQRSSTVVTTFARKLTGKIDKAGDLGNLITGTGHQLKVSWGSALLVIRKRFLADTTPTAYCINQIPKKYMEGVDFSVENLAEQIYSFIEKECNLSFSHDFMDIIPSITNEKLSEMLKLDYHTPLLRFDITKHTIKGEPIMFNTDYYVHDLIKFTAGRTISHS